MEQLHSATQKVQSGASSTRELQAQNILCAPNFTFLISSVSFFMISVNLITSSSLKTTRRLTSSLNIYTTHHHRHQPRVVATQFTFGAEFLIISNVRSSGAKPSQPEEEARPALVNIAPATLLSNSLPSKVQNEHLVPCLANDDG